MSAIPKDKGLYERIKKDIYIKIPKHSAYRSGILTKKYKEEYMKKYGNNNAYEGKKDKTKGLSRWINEKWRNQRGEIGYKKEGDIYRPTIRINKDTPTTFNELSANQIKRAIKEKKTKGRVKKFDLGSRKADI